MKKIVKHLIIFCLLCSLQTFSQTTTVDPIVFKDNSTTNSSITLPQVLLIFDAIINDIKV